jgi:hypothetical protein
MQRQKQRSWGTRCRDLEKKIILWVKRDAGNFAARAKAGRQPK